MPQASASPDALASRAGLTLLDHRYGCLPVVDEHQMLVGILTERDFLRFAVRTIEMHDPERLPLPRARTRTSSASIRGCASPHTLDSVAELL